MSKIFRNICAVMTSLSLAAVNCTVQAEAVDNVNHFTAVYTEAADNTLELELSVGGELDLTCFDCIVSYDTSKYSVLNCNVINPDGCINNMAETGEVLLAFSPTVPVAGPSDIMKISFECRGRADENDFEVRIFNLCDSELELDTVGFTLDTVWNGKNVTVPDKPVQTTVPSAVTTTTKPAAPAATTTAATGPASPSDGENILYYYSRENKAKNSVELVFGIKGDVKFMGIEGNFAISADGLGEPVITQSAPGMLPSYFSETNSIDFSFTSPTGNDITEPTELFVYSFEIIDSNYSFSAEPNISYIFDKDMEDINYSVVNEEDTEPEINTIPGDVNNDDVVNVKDVILIRRYLVSGWKIELDEQIADVNKDGVVNVKDAILIRRYLVSGWNIELK